MDRSSTPNVSAAALTGIFVLGIVVGALIYRANSPSADPHRSRWYHGQVETVTRNSSAEEASGGQKAEEVSPGRKAEEATQAGRLESATGPTP